MQKSSFAVLILCGVLVACLPRLVAPSDNYISDSLGMSVEDFYITSQPVGGSFSYNSRVNLIVDTNIQHDVSYNWQWSTNGEYWTDVGQSYSQQQIFTFYFYTNSFYRCACTYDNQTIYSAPVFCGSTQGQQGGQQQKSILPFGDTPTEEIKEDVKEIPTEEIKEEPTEELKKEVEEIE